MTPEQIAVRNISDRIVAAQQNIRILDAIKWSDEVKQAFFKSKCKALPLIDQDYYKKQALPFKADELLKVFHTIIRDAENQLGMYSGITRLIKARCEDYCKAIQMLSARGTPEFSELSKELYGSPDDAFYPGGPRLCDFGVLLGDALQTLTKQTLTSADEKQYSANEATEIIQKKLSDYFVKHKEQVVVKVSDTLIADAAAGADTITLNSHVRFSDRDLKYLEVHEGWVHIGTTLNGLEQPYCTFLSKGSPASSVTQEGLAVITEIFTFSSYPRRMLKLLNRIKAIDLVCQGANFIEVFKFFRGEGRSEEESYHYAVRVFRGSTPEGQPFTKDLSYTRGFVLIYNYIRLAVRHGLVDRIPLFFLGKVLIDEVQTLSELLEQGLVKEPLYIPPQFKDLAALSAWMSFSLFLNKFDLQALEQHYRFMLHG